MNIVEYVKALARPFITGFLILGWILFIASEIEYPATYEWAALGSLAWWGLDRTLLHKHERSKNG